MNEGAAAIVGQNGTSVSVENGQLTLIGSQIYDVTGKLNVKLLEPAILVPIAEVDRSNCTSVGVSLGGETFPVAVQYARQGHSQHGQVDAGVGVNPDTARKQEKLKKTNHAGNLLVPNVPKFKEGCELIGNKLHEAFAPAAPATPVERKNEAAVPEISIDTIQDDVNVILSDMAENAPELPKKTVKKRSQQPTKKIGKTQKQEPKKIGRTVRKRASEVVEYANEPTFEAPAKIEEKSNKSQKKEVNRKPKAPSDEEKEAHIRPLVREDILPILVPVAQAIVPIFEENERQKAILEAGIFTYFDQKMTEFNAESTKKFHEFSPRDQGKFKAEWLKDYTNLCQTGVAGVVARPILDVVENVIKLAADNAQTSTRRLTRAVGVPAPLAQDAGDVIGAIVYLGASFSNPGNMVRNIANSGKVLKTTAALSETAVTAEKVVVTAKPAAKNTTAATLKTPAAKGKTPAKNPAIGRTPAPKTPAPITVTGTQIQISVTPAAAAPKAQRPRVKKNETSVAAANPTPRNDLPYNPREVRNVLEQRYPGQVTQSTVPDMSKPNVRFAGQRHEKTGMVLDNRGHPIMDDVTIFDIKIGEQYFRVKKEKLHMREATRLLRTEINAGRVNPNQFTPAQLGAIQRGRDKIPGLTWHHHQDVGRMQLVPRNLHNEIAHIGGMKMWVFD